MTLGYTKIKDQPTMVVANGIKLVILWDDPPKVQPSGFGRLKQWVKNPTADPIGWDNDGDEIIGWDNDG